MAVESTPERSFSLLFNSSRAAEAITGWAPAAPRCGVVIIAMQRFLDRAARIGQQCRNTGQRLVLFGIQHMQDCPDQERVAGLLPMVPALQGSLGIDQDVGNVLDVTHLPLPATDLQQGIVGGRRCVRRIEQQDTTMLATKPRCQLEVLSFDIVDDRAAGPRQERRHYEPDALAAARRCKTQDVLGAIVAQVLLIEPSKHDAVWTQKTGAARLAGCRPTR